MSRAEIRVIDAGPIPFSSLPMQEDADLRGQLDARYGLSLDRYQFQLVELPLRLLVDAEQIPANGLAFYEQLAREDEELRAQLEAEHGPEDGWPEWVAEEFEEAFDGGAERAQIVRDYRDRVAAGEQLQPLVIDWLYLSDESEQVSILDGFHRACGTFEARVATVQAYELLADD
jgi:hypothetical protein